MHRSISLGIVIALLASPRAWPQSVDSEFRLSAAIASDYKRYGLSQTYSSPATSLAADFAHRSGFYLGALLTNVEYDSDRFFRNQRDTQLSAYAGYLWRFSDWTANVSLIHYSYPGFAVDYDYSEVAAGISYRDRYFLDFSRSNDYLSIDRTAYQYRAGLAWPWIRDIEVGINAGIFRSSELFGTEYSFWDAGVSRGFGRFALDLRYHDNTYGYSSLLGEDGSDRWVLSVAYSILPR